MAVLRGHQKANASRSPQLCGAVGIPAPKACVGAALVAAAVALEAQAAALQAQAAALRVLAVENFGDARPSSDTLLGLAELKKGYGIGRDGLLAAVQRGELRAERGTRGRILVRQSEVDGWLASRPVLPKEAVSRPADALGEWQRRAELRRLELGRKA